VSEYADTVIRKKELYHNLWGKEFGRDDALVVRQTAQLIHESVSLGFDEKPLFIFHHFLIGTNCASLFVWGLL
jgi:hypothetical protein